MRKLILFLLLFVLSCAPGSVQVSRSHSSISNHSVVTLIAPILILDGKGIPIGIGYADSCNAFGIDRLGTQLLLTAAHCLSGMEVGDEFKYREPNGVGFGTAELIWLDPAGDRAAASISDPLISSLDIDLEYVPNAGDETVTISSLHGGVSRGAVIGELAHGWFDTTQSVGFGWSGSPVVNEAGSVWGILSMCRLQDEESDCDPGYAIVTQIP
jgi:hypothetical protein